MVWCTLADEWLVVCVGGWGWGWGLSSIGGGGGSGGSILIEACNVSGEGTVRAVGGESLTGSGGGGGGRVAVHARLVSPELVSCYFWLLGVSWSYDVCLSVCLQIGRAHV